MKRIFMIMLAAVLLLPAMVTGQAESASKGKILVVASSQDKMELANGSIMDVGFFLNEFAVPAQYLADQALQIAGGIMVEGNLYQSNVIRDRELITGQNPASDIALAKELDKALSNK